MPQSKKIRNIPQGSSTNVQELKHKKLIKVKVMFRVMSARIINRKWASVITIIESIAI